MSVAGLCQICESAEAEHSCVRCGALVCDEHFDSDHGLCATCVAETSRGGDGDPGRGGGRRFDDEDVPGEYEY